jgi:RecG-like helicase
MPRHKNAYLKRTQDLDLPLSSIQGIGPKRAVYFSIKGIHTILDLLFFTPFRYEDRRKITPMSEAQEGPPVLVKGKVVFGREDRLRGRKRMFRSAFVMQVREWNSSGSITGDPIFPNWLKNRNCLPTAWLP